MFGIGGGVGLVIAGVLVDNSASHWIFWLGVVASASPRWATWRYVPESPVRVQARDRLARRRAADASRCARCCSA